MKLKPCPFCGNKKPRVCVSRGCDLKTIIGYMVACEPDEKPCGAQGPIVGNRAKAVRLWNRRAA